MVKKIILKIFLRETLTVSYVEVVNYFNYKKKLLKKSPLKRKKSTYMTLLAELLADFLHNTAEGS